MKVDGEPSHSNESTEKLYKLLHVVTDKDKTETQKVKKIHDRFTANYPLIKNRISTMDLKPETHKPNMKAQIFNCNK